MIPIYVDNIKHSLKNKCYFSALSLALTLPDICGMAEFPNKTVAERYTEWYDKYLGIYMAQGKDDLGNNPWLSGEVVYNLRNTYLHQGNPGIVSDKVKEEINQLDQFILILGDGTVLQTAALNIEAGTQKTGKVTYRAIIVDVTYLCNTICDYALWYYENNKRKFKFNFNVITQEEFMHPSVEALQFTQGDVYTKILNQKLKREGSTKRFVQRPNHRTLDRMRDDIDVIFSDENMKQRFLNGDSVFTFTHPSQPTNLLETGNKVIGTSKEKAEEKNKNTKIKKEQKQNTKSKTGSMEKREAQVRSFFGRYFKKKIYLEKKEEIIQAVLQSKTKLQVNNNLMKHFTSKEVSTIYQILDPLIKDLPGK